jgi:hypothetical protein
MWHNFMRWINPDGWLPSVARIMESISEGRSKSNICFFVVTGKKETTKVPKLDGLLSPLDGVHHLSPDSRMEEGRAIKSFTTTM